MDGDGQLRFDQLLSSLEWLGVVADKQMLNEMWTLMDVDGVGCISRSRHQDPSKLVLLCPDDCVSTTNMAVCQAGFICCRFKCTVLELGRGHHTATGRAIGSADGLDLGWNGLIANGRDSGSESGDSQVSSVAGQGAADAFQLLVHR